MRTRLGDWAITLAAVGMRSCRRWATRMSSRSGRATVLALVAACLALGQAAVGGDAVEDLLFDLQLIPLDGQSPSAFTLEALDGARVSLADFRGKVVLLYFWATW